MKAERKKIQFADGIEIARLKFMGLHWQKLRARQPTHFTAAARFTDNLLRRELLFRVVTRKGDLLNLLNVNVNLIPHFHKPHSADQTIR